MLPQLTPQNWQRMKQLRRSNPKTPPQTPNQARCRRRKCLAEPQPSEAASSAPATEAAADVVQAAAAQDGSAAEPVLIEVWRPGRTEGSHRPRRHRERRRPKHAGAASSQRAAEPAVAAAPAGEAAASPTAEQTPPSRRRGAKARTTIRATAAGMAASIDPIGRNATVTGHNASAIGRRSSASSGAKKRPIQIRRLPSSRP